MKLAQQPPLSLTVYSSHYDLLNLFQIKISNPLFCSKSFGEFVAEIVVIVDKEEWDARGDTANAMSVEKALEKAARSGRIGSLQVDTESLKLKEAGKL